MVLSRDCGHCRDQQRGIVQPIMLRQRINVNLSFLPVPNALQAVDAVIEDTGWANETQVPPPPTLSFSVHRRLQSHLASDSEESRISN
jgi:hypothetical protein